MIKTRKHKLSKEQELEIVESYRYNKISANKIGKNYGVSGHTILRLLSKYGIEDRSIQKFILNHSFFKKIDTEEKAYFLGLMYADGCIMEPRKFVYIGLQDRDKDIIDKFIKALDSNIVPLLIDRGNPKWRNAYRIRFTSKEMFYDLLGLGCVPNKSLILKFPTEEQVPKHLIQHFIRGYFDGDGHVRLGRCSRIDIVSTKSFCEELKKTLDKEGITESVVKNAKINNITHRFCIYRKLTTIKFLEWIYRDATIYLKRKYEIYENGLKLRKTGDKGIAATPLPHQN